MSNGYGRSAPFPITAEQSVRLIVRTCLDEGVTDHRQIAYVLATAQHETGGFRGPEEDFGRRQAVTIGYHGGEDYFGRGYVHLTHDENYRTTGAALGMGDQLYDDPARAAEPEIAARVLVAGMRDGHFARAHTLDRHIDDRNADYVRARQIVNGTDRAQHVAGLARGWEVRIADLVDEVRRDGVDLTPVAAPRSPDAPLQRGDANARVFELQQYLVALGVTNRAGQPLAPDGDFGPSTRQAVHNYQTRAGIDPPAAMVDEVLLARIRSEVLRGDPHFRLRSIDDLYGPLSDGVLTRDECGDAIEDLQQQLRGLGYLAHDGSPLGVSRRYDLATENAVLRFQEDAGIEPDDGLADERTRDAINARAVERGLREAAEAVRRREQGQAGREAELLNQPQVLRPAARLMPGPEVALGEAERAMLAQLRDQVRMIDRQVAKGWDESSERLAASALVMAKESGFGPRSRLGLGLNLPTEEFAGGTVLHLTRMGHGASANPAENHAWMPIADALSQAAEDRYRQAVAVAGVQTRQSEAGQHAMWMPGAAPSEPEAQLWMGG